MTIIIKPVLGEMADKLYILYELGQLDAPIGIMTHFELKKLADSIGDAMVKTDQLLNKRK